MASVSARILKVRQPYGGYVSPSSFHAIDMDDGLKLKRENINTHLISQTVISLARFMTGTPVEAAFTDSIQGYKAMKKHLGLIKKVGETVSGNKAKKLLEKVKSLDESSILAACEACSYNVWHQNPGFAKKNAKAKYVAPNADTIKNIKIMVMRTIMFVRHYGPIKATKANFKPYGYTATVSSGECDFLTSDTLWTLKMFRENLNEDLTLEAVMYYIMGRHSGKAEYKTIKKLGIFNPRLNRVYILEIDRVAKDTLKLISKEVIGYH